MIPKEFEPARTADFGKFQLVVLAPDLAEQDHKAVLASADNIRHVFGPTNGWPPSNITFEENLADLTRHAREFDERVAFAYALLDVAQNAYLGCLYIKPIKSRIAADRRKQLFQAQAFLWLSSTQSLVSDDNVFATLRDWLSRQWPFEAVAWPGRSPSWLEWDTLGRSA